ncbi:phosphate acyltransferase PlsX [Micromonospora sp. NPDC005194]|uniref:phosphate acyltransferase PlsX n=1 Tax=Micromonospora sp. NPDC005194 TaxID=3156870 RepID=UPI0033A3D59C
MASQGASPDRRLRVAGQEASPERRLRVAVDVAGADLGPEPVVAGALAAAATVDIALVGPQALIRPLLPGGVAPAGVRVVHAPDVVGMGEDPVAATYAKRRSSLLVAAGEVAAGRADAMVTPGNTGAAVLAAAVRLGRVPGVSNPALATVLPVPGAGPTVLLDIGATAAAVPEWLVEFAVLGAEYARGRLGLARPRIGLLSNGHEAVKGGPVRRDAHLLLATMPGYSGQIEAYDVLGGRVDVAVTDGFTGDVALKMYERTLDATVGLALDAVRAFSPIGALARERRRRVTRAVRDGLAAEPGGALLGVRGVCVICHGTATAVDVEASVRIAGECVRSGVVERIAAAFAASSRQRLRSRRSPVDG